MVRLDVVQTFADLLDDLCQQRRVEDAGGLETTAQAEPGQFQPLQERFDIAGLLCSPHMLSRIGVKK
ncbi:hypothetical protein HQ520_02490 [bacterium]|nr:hypothetical protein [bacterium]